MQALRLWHFGRSTMLPFIRSSPSYMSTTQPEHTRRTTSADDDEIDPLVDQQGCGKVYARLEECLGENNRDWRLCQQEVKALRECYVKAQQATQASK